MSETHDNALFISPEEGVHDGCFLFTKPRCPIKLAAYRERIEALPKIPSANFQIKSMQMGLLRPTKTDEDWRQMIDRILESTKGGDAVPASNSSQST
jgi:hypothetical protein